jgi:hypothetical protein
VLAAALAWATPPASSRRAPALGLAAGGLYAAADLATKAVTAGALGWLGPAAAATLAAFFAFQRGLQLGRPVTVIALMTAGTNVTAIAGGLAVFGDPLGRTPLLQTLHVTGFALVGIAGWALAPAQAPALA